MSSLWLGYRVHPTSYESPEGSRLCNTIDINRHASRRENIGEEDIAIQNRSRLRLRDDARKRIKRQKRELSLAEEL